VKPTTSAAMVNFVWVTPEPFDTPPCRPFVPVRLALPLAY
jgi:hypothetical protein